MICMLLGSLDLQREKCQSKGRAPIVIRCFAFASCRMTARHSKLNPHMLGIWRCGVPISTYGKHFLLRCWCTVSIALPILMVTFFIEVLWHDS